MTAAEKEYGGALYSLAAEEQQEDEILAGLGQVKQVLTENPAYSKLLANPAVKKEERLSLLDEALRGAVHPYVLNFCKILCEKCALACLSGCEAEFRARLYETRGILPVTATTAVPLTDAQSKGLKEKLESVTGKHVLLESYVDARVLGGVKLAYAGKELDGTAAGKLAALRAQLLAQ